MSVERLLLGLMLLSICLSPRLRLAGLEDYGDLRIQDFVLVIALLVCLLPSQIRDRGSLAKAMGVLPWLFGAFGLLLLVWHSTATPVVSMVRGLAFLGRPVELFILAGVLATLYLRSGTRRLQTVLHTLHFSALANGVWMVYQYLTGIQATLLGSDVGGLAAAYGPMLIGEGSAFGTGQFWVFIAALAVAERRAGLAPTWLTASLLVFSVFATMLADSRISLGVVLILVVLYVGLAREGRLRLNPIAATFLILVGAACALLLIPRLDGRESPEAILFSLLFRVDNIWSDVLQLIGDHLLLGVGPGAIPFHLGKTEAHNIMLRAVLEFGLIAGSCFLLAFILVLVRAVQRANNAGDDTELVFGSYLALLVVGGVFVSGMVQDALTAVTSSHLTMIAIGLFAAACQRHDADDPPQLRRKPELVDIKLFAPNRVQARRL